MQQIKKGELSRKVSDLFATRHEDLYSDDRVNHELDSWRQ